MIMISELLGSSLCFTAFIFIVGVITGFFIGINVWDRQWRWASEDREERHKSTRKGT